MLVKSPGVYQTEGLLNNEEIHYYMATQAYTTPFTVIESPVLSMPIALSTESMPISIQVVGKRFEDFRLLEVGKVIESYAPNIDFPLQE